ncbi:MAG: hypothetical protein AAGA01_18425, partial [Cyanobacteria bacterium P01_E01_bin.43]
MSLVSDFCFFKRFCGAMSRGEISPNQTIARPYLMKWFKELKAQAKNHPNRAYMLMQKISLLGLKTRMAGANYVLLNKEL